MIGHYSALLNYTSEFEFIYTVSGDKSEIMSLYFEVYNWCRENMANTHKFEIQSPYYFTVYFSNRDDYILFKMRWS